MNFSKVLRDICCDSRVKNGTPNLEDPDFCFVMQEYLLEFGIPEDEVISKTSMLFEAGKFPDRQAYNSDGLLVTFPTKNHRDRAVDKGTHFAENPKQSKPTIFTNNNDADALSVSDIPKEPSDDISKVVSTEPVDDSTDMNDSFVTVDDYVEQRGDNIDMRSKDEKKRDASAVADILHNDPESDRVGYSMTESTYILNAHGFKKNENTWISDDNKIVAEQIYDEVAGKPVVKLLPENINSDIYTKMINEFNIIN
jgi:hypothetical protein